PNPSISPLSLHDALPILSDNRFKRLDISDARELLGYAPQDDLTRENPKLRALDLRETARAHNVRDPDQKSGARCVLSRFRASPTDRKSTRLNSSHVAISY